MSKMLFLKNILLNNTSQGLQFGSRWLFNITLLNVLDINDYAVFSFVYSISNILMAVIPFGSSPFLIHKVKHIKHDREELSHSFLFSTFIFLAICIVYFFLTPFLSDVKGWSFSIYGIILGYVLSLNLLLFSFYKGAGNFFKELNAYLLFFIVLSLFIVYLFFVEDPYKSLPFIFVVLILVNILIFVVAVVKNHSDFSGWLNRIKSFNRVTFRKNFLDRKYFGYQEIVTAFYTQSGLIFLFYLLDTETYGYYRALFVIIIPVYLITVSMSQVVLSFLKDLQGAELLQKFRKLQGISFLAGLGVLTILFLLRDFIFQIIKIPVTDMTQWAFIIVLGTALMRFVFTNYEMVLIILNKQKFRFYVVFVVAILHIILVFALLPKYGLIGAVFTNLIAYALLLVGLLVFTENLLKLKKNYKS